MQELSHSSKAKCWKQFPSFKETSHTLVWDKENINEQPLKDTPSYKILIYVLKEIRDVNT